MLFLLGIAFAGKPGMPSVSESEASTLAKGNVVTRSAPGDGMSGAMGLVKVNASKDAVWKVLLDLEMVKASSGAVQSIDKYRDEAGPPRVMGLHYVLKVAWSEVTYYVLREFHASEDYMTWTLDPSKKSDLVRTEGFYALYPYEGAVLLAYQSRADSGRNVPQWIQTMLTSKTMKGYLDMVRKGAEG